MRNYVCYPFLLMLEEIFKVQLINQRFLELENFFSFIQSLNVLLLSKHF